MPATVARRFSSSSSTRSLGHLPGSGCGSFAGGPLPLAGACCLLWVRAKNAVEERIITSWMMASTPSSCIASSWTSAGMYAHRGRAVCQLPTDRVSSQPRSAAGVVRPSCRRPVSSTSTGWSGRCSSSQSCTSAPRYPGRESQMRGLTTELHVKRGPGGPRR